MEKPSKFVLFKKIALEDLKVGVELDEADYTKFHKGFVYQFKEVESKSHLNPVVLKFRKGRKKV